MKLSYSGSPHFRNNKTTKGIMIDVCIALAPAFIASIVYFGVWSLITVLSAVLGALLSELLYKLAVKKEFKQILEEFDYTSLVTGLLVGLNMPPLSIANVYIPFLSSVFAIVVIKMLFGGTGCNIVNPAIAGRVFALMSFTTIMTQGFVYPNVSALAGSSSFVSGATPLTEMLITGLKAGGQIANTNLTNLDLFLGTGLQGTIGETSKLALVLGGVYLCIKGVINPLYPILYIVSEGLFAVALNGFNFAFFMPSILSGGLFLGAIFMATDYVTTPNSTLGNVIYFVLLGLLTAGLRHACQMEVVSFCIMLMNLIVPLIDKYVVPKPFGYVKPQKKEGK
ncbi:MAG: RnfABCDGE type electron transport complex subunit D [Clostridia bacterium]|nr:RnfABCDGE type electron transport complex subunit D [Clostridia bacterium]